MDTSNEAFVVTMLGDILKRITSVEDKIDDAKAQAETATTVGQSAHQLISEHVENSAKRHAQSEAAIAKLQESVERIETDSKSADMTTNSALLLSLVGLLCLLCAGALFWGGLAYWEQISGLLRPFGFGFAPNPPAEMLSSVSFGLGLVGVASVFMVVRFLISRSWLTRFRKKD